MGIRFKNVDHVSVIFQVTRSYHADLNNMTWYGKENIIEDMIYTIITTRCLIQFFARQYLLAPLTISKDIIISIGVKIKYNILRLLVSI